MSMMLGVAGFDPNNPTTWISVAANGGLAFLVFFAFIKGWVVPGFILDRAEQRVKSQDEQIAKMTDVFQQQMIPALTKATDVNQDVYDYLVAERMGTTLPRPKRRA